MSPQQTDLNDRLIQVLQDQIDAYAQLHPLADELAICYDLGNRSQQLLQQLNELIMEAVKRDELILSLRAQLREHSESVRDDVQQKSSELANSIQLGMRLFDKIESKAIAARDQLVPQVNRQVRARKMKTAYHYQAESS